MKSLYHSLIAGLGCLWLLTACVTEYQPDTVSVARALVVEGQITDQPGPYRIRLTRTTDYTLSSLNLLETGAIVTIEDDLGNRETLQEESGGGSYVTKDNGIRGVAGRRYTLKIQTKVGKQYESDAELLPSAPPIQKLYYEYRNEPIPGLPARKQGWDVYLDTKDPEALGNYYRWEWTHYEFTEVCRKTEVPGASYYTGIGCCSPCWDIDRCYDCISLNSDANINGQSISRQPIMQVPYTSKGRYYLEVQQQALSRGAYEYWKSVRQLVNNTGGLFDAAPSTIRGNVRCVNDPAEATYGYFGATGVAEQFIFVDRSAGQGVPDIDLPVVIPYPSNPPCIVCENSLYRTRVEPRWWAY